MMYDSFSVWQITTLDLTAPASDQKLGFWLKYLHPVNYSSHKNGSLNEGEIKFHGNNAKILSPRSSFI